MNTKALLICVALALLCCGCSRTKTVNVLSLKWNIGQHMDCFYAGQNIYCLPSSLKTFSGVPLEGIGRDKKPISRTAGLLYYSVAIVHMMERNRSELEKDPHGESGTYSTKFSGSPSDYSLWDCYKTGAGDPAIACQFIEKPDGSKNSLTGDLTVREWVAKQAEAARFETDVLLSLLPEGLKQACGAPQETTNDSISSTLSYPSTRPGVLVKLRFDTYDSTKLDSIETSEPKGPDGNYPAEHVWWWRNSDLMSLYEIPGVMKEMPCLLKK